MIRRGKAAPPGRERGLPRRRGRSVLVLIALFLIGSGLLRLGDGTGLAIARELGGLVTAAFAAPPGQTGDPGQDLEPLLEALRVREARLAEAEARLDERSRALSVAEEEVQRGLAALNEAERSLEGLLAVADTAAEKDVATLTSVYEAMKPADASALFDQMDPVFAAGFLARMRADVAAAILAGLPPEKAYALSVVLAGRNAAVLRN